MVKTVKYLKEITLSPCLGIYFPLQSLTLYNIVLLTPFECKVITPGS